MSEYFKWKLLILDDNPQFYSNATKHLEDAGMSVKILDSFPGIINAQNVVSNSHIALVDMQWDAGNIEPYPECGSFLPKERSFCAGIDLADIRRQWLQAISKWVHSEPTRDGHEWPRQKIEEEHVGAWIGALLSWIAPNTQLLFFSQFERIFEGGIQAALSNFRDPPFSVTPKTVDEAGKVYLKVMNLNEALVVQQKQLLQDPEIFDWFFSSVLLPVLTEEEPSETECSVFYWGSGAPEKRTLKFEFFFPNLLKSPPGELWKHLRGYLSHPMLSQNDIKYIKLVSHALKDRETIRLEDLRRARHYAILANIWGEELVRQIDLLLSRAKSSTKNSIASDDEDFKRLLTACESFTGDPTGSFKNLSDKSQWNVRLLNFSTSSADSSLAKVKFPFCPISWLGEMLDHLVSNAERFSQAWSASMEDDGKHLRFQFLSLWAGSLDRKKFWRCVKDSANDGLDRGLPLVVRRALECGADACLLRAGNDNTWLYGNASDSFCDSDSEPNETRFEIYLFFRTESQL